MLSAFESDRLISPYLIFIKFQGEFSDADLLSKFRLESRKQATEVPTLDPYVILGNTGDWTVLADDWSYNLWHAESTRKSISQVAEFADVYACAIGDCDHSFDFIYYSRGELLRKYVVVDPTFRDGEVAESHGDVLPGEAEALSYGDEQQKVLALAVGLGIPLPIPNESIRIYQQPKNWWH